MRMIKALFYVLVITSAILPAIAQKNTPIPEEKFRLGLIYYYPSFNGGDDISFLSGWYELHGEVTLSEKFSLFGVFPYSTYSVNDESASGFGNLLLGGKIALSDDRSLISHIGAALPTISDDNDVRSANLLSGIGKYYELLMFFPDFLTIFADAEKKFNFVGGYYADAKIGIAAFIPTGDKDDEETEFLVPYKLGFGYEKPEMVAFSASLNGIYLMTVDTDNDKLFHALRFEVKYPGATFEPGFRFELPLNSDYSDYVDYLIGIQLLFKFL